MNKADIISCVSVIVPCYNYGRYLADALNSVQMQTLKDWECIVVDDGSSDNTKEVVARFSQLDDRFRYWYQENSGVSGARNTGIRNTSGKYIQFLDADDIIESEKLEIQVNYLECHQNLDLVYGDARFFSTENPEALYFSFQEDNDDWMPRVSGNSDLLLKYLVKSNFMVVSSPLLARRLVDTNGLFNEDLKSHEDWEFWLRCAINGAYFKYLKAENTYALIRTHDKSLSNKSLEMYVSNLAVRNQLASKLKGLHLKIVNCERIFSYSFKALMILFKRDRTGAISFYLKHLPFNHGILAFCGGFLKFNYMVLKSLITLNQRSRSRS